MTTQELYSHRTQSNMILLEVLMSYLSENPQMRIGQALFNLGFVERGQEGTVKDPFYEEPWDTIKRVSERCPELNLQNTESIN